MTSFRSVVLFCAAMLAVSPVYAEKWFEMPNQAGGKILLLESKCADTPQRAKETVGLLVIGTSDTGGSVKGCWYYFADMVHIVWQDGTSSSFPPDRFSLKERK